MLKELNGESGREQTVIEMLSARNALACDMRFAARESAILCQLEAAFGLVQGVGAIQQLTRLMGRGRAPSSVFFASLAKEASMSSIDRSNRN